MSKLADNEDELVLEDQTITSPAPPKTKDSDEAVQLLVTAEIENGHDETSDEAVQENPEQLLIQLDEPKAEQPCVESKEDDKAEEEMEEAPAKVDEVKEVLELPPPPPPKRTSQTNQRLKKLSKMIKYTIPSKMPSPLMPSKKSKVERKSLKDKATENELTAFLKERRAVSESRFTLVDKGRSPSPAGIIERTKSDPDMSSAEDASSGKKNKDEDKDYGPNAWGMSPDNIKTLVEKFERQASPQPAVSPTRSLKSPSRDLKSPELVIKADHGKSKSPSPQRNSSVTIKNPAYTEPDKQSTTSPESGLDDNSKSESESKKGISTLDTYLFRVMDTKSIIDLMLKLLCIGSKKSRKDKKDRRRHSGCEACNSDREHKEHKKDKKRSKKDQQKRKKVTINSDTETKKSKASCNGTGRPPMPKSEDLGPPRDGFFKQLLIINEQEKKQAEAQQALVENQIQRTSRLTQKKSASIVHRPSFNTFLKERSKVSESKFRRDSSMSPIERTGTRYLPPGVLQGEQYFEHRAKFENGMKPVATFPRSLSNLERRSSSAVSHQGNNKQDDLRPTSSLSRGSSLPRPGSAGSSIDAEEYKNYVLEMIHSTQKNPRFQQLQAYYNLLDRALKLEKQSSNMDIHKLKSEAVVDFETWRKLRGKEKAKDELHLLMSSLREAQRARQFHFRPKEVASVRWRGDIRLRGRDKSVENLKNHFSKIAEQNGLTNEHVTKVQELNETKDVYKPKWRGSPVNKDIKRLQQPGKCPTPIANTLPRSTKSSLTPQQVNHLKGQLTEILDHSSRPSTMSKYEIQVHKINDQFKPKDLVVKPLKTQREIESEQRELSFKIGQEIKSLRQSQDQPREFNQDDKNDFLIVLTSPTQNEEVKANIQSCLDQGEEERPKSVNDIAKAFEERSLSPTRVASPPPIETGLSVREVKQSFEKLNELDSNKSKEPKLPVRTSSFYKAIEQGQKCPSLGKLSKSTSSLENLLDEEVKPPPAFHHYNDFSMSNPDISDNESKKKHSRYDWTNSNLYLDPVGSPILNNYGHYGQKVSDNGTKYSRAYLTLVKAGSVNTKLTKFEDPKVLKWSRGYSQKTLNKTNKRLEKDKDYVAKHITDPSKVIIKTKEVGNVNDIRQRLEMKAKSPIPFQAQQALAASVAHQEETLQPKLSITWNDQKAKLKHFCKKMSHSKILNKMIALQCATQSQTLDKGTEKLIFKTTQEDILKSVYQSGKVESKLDLFERPAPRPQSPAPAWAQRQDTAFSWSKRLNPTDCATSAQKHNQFRKYYGYHPGDQPKSLMEQKNQKNNELQPASLPVYLESLPPPPPIRGYYSFKQSF